MNVIYSVVFAAAVLNIILSIVNGNTQALYAWIVASLAVLSHLLESVWDID